MNGPFRIGYRENCNGRSIRDLRKLKSFEQACSKYSAFDSLSDSGDNFLVGYRIKRELTAMPRLRFDADAARSI
ncbi:hypothetical protein HDF12_003926 [Edaphobacter lichenicola]|uniref:Uncharacterized protein n=1 Tax=Tunturiibacter lichenicola TaxID=2051959 RepID=A0A7Y9NQI2_9BACT|nr:hypothetical protein [Edaphobacter lichenicola]